VGFEHQLAALHAEESSQHRLLNRDSVLAGRLRFITRSPATRMWAVVSRAPQQLSEIMIQIEI
jgi:hypothetical protein